MLTSSRLHLVVNIRAANLFFFFVSSYAPMLTLLSLIRSAMARNIRAVAPQM